MRLSEIDKETFHRKLVDPAKQELLDLIAIFDSMEGVHCKLEEYRPDLAEFHVRVFDDTKSIQREVVKYIAIKIMDSQHWAWDTCHTPKNPNTVWVCFVTGK